MAKKPQLRTISLEVPVGDVPPKPANSLNDNIPVDIFLDARQSDALRALFAGLKTSMRYPLHRPVMGLVWFLEEIAAQMETK